MQDRPTVHELLAAVARFLDDEVVPAAEGRRQFLARVAANAVRLVDRELAHEEEHLRADWAGLDALLGAQPLPDSRQEIRAAVARRTEELCERIRRGDADADGAWRSSVLAHVRRAARDKLVVTNQAWLDADARHADGAATG